jgi:hypothetical protein
MIDIAVLESGPGDHVVLTGPDLVEPVMSQGATAIDQGVEFGRAHRRHLLSVCRSGADP